jgi:pSer/pThr/pTyr-binding forkhead associated (FHA) protein
MAIVLIIREGGTTKKVRLTSKPLIAGRSSKSPLQINDGLCSGQHCAFVINKDSRVLVKDLESTNGTFLNDCKIMDSHIMLDDVIKIGECEISIDRDELTTKEKKQLTRDEPTSRIKFVNLDPSKKNIKPSEALRAKKEALAKAEKEKALQKEERLKKRAKKLLKAKEKETTLASERTIDLEESSGSTKMIKIGKPKKNKKSLANKIKGVFKK